jgi:Fe2+ transport system protein B
MCGGKLVGVDRCAVVSNKGALSRNLNIYMLLVAEFVACADVWCLCCVYALQQQAMLLSGWCASGTSVGQQLC